MSAMILEAVDTAAAELVELVGVKKACAAVGMARASYYRKPDRRASCWRPGRRYGALSADL